MRWKYTTPKSSLSVDLFIFSNLIFRCNFSFRYTHCTTFTCRFCPINVAIHVLTAIDNVLKEIEMCSNILLADSDIWTIDKPEYLKEFKAWAPTAEVYDQNIIRYAGRTGCGPSPIHTVRVRPITIRYYIFTVCRAGLSKNWPRTDLKWKRSWRCRALSSGSTAL